MPDISMCAAENCPVAARCYRHAASGTKPDEFLQSYSGFEPEKGEACRGFTRVGHIFKFNNGCGALLCSGCRTILLTGNGPYEDAPHYCETCSRKRA
jgi:hypothetical protein